MGPQRVRQDWVPFTFICVLCLIFKGNLITFGSKRRKSQEEREGLAELMPPNSFTFGSALLPLPFLTASLLFREWALYGRWLPTGRLASWVGGSSASRISFLWVLVLRLNPKTETFEGCSPDTHTAAAPTTAHSPCRIQSEKWPDPKLRGKTHKSGLWEVWKGFQTVLQTARLGGTSEEYKEHSAGARVSSRSGFKEGCSELDFCSLLEGLSRISCVCCCSVAKLCLTLCDPMDCSTPGSPVLHCLPEFVQTPVHWVGDAV